ncbi:MAG: hypothetical protein ACXVHX_02245 [Solirubrobacteraceae bacterium]
MKLAFDVVLFVGTTVALSVLAQNERWVWFAMVAAACVAVYILLRIAEAAPVLAYLQSRDERNHHLLNAFDQFGIRDLYNMQIDDEAAARNRATVEIINGGTDFALSGSTGASYLDPKMHRHWPHVREKLSDGCRFRLLLTDPYSEAKVIRNKLNGVLSEIDPKLDLDNLVRMLSKYSSLEVRFTDQVYCSVFFTEHEMVYDPYHLGQVFDRLENRFFAVRLDDAVEASGASYFRQLKNHFEYLWSAGQTWEAFQERHSQLFRAREDNV